jgi:hypothetical protein
MDPVKTPLLPETTRKHLQKILEPHAVKIEVHDQPEEGERYPYCLFHLPEGTLKERDGFVGAYHEHNKITLPDGFVFFQEVDADSWSSISFPIEEKDKLPHG